MTPTTATVTMTTTTIARPLLGDLSAVTALAVTLLGDLLGDGTSAPGTATQAVKGLAEVLPAAQLVQAPPLVEVLPASQLVQAPPLIDTWLSEQSTQVVKGLAEVLPAAQLVQGDGDSDVVLNGCSRGQDEHRPGRA